MTNVKIYHTQLIYTAKFYQNCSKTGNQLSTLLATELANLPEYHRWFRKDEFFIYIYISLYGYCLVHKSGNFVNF